MSENTQRRLAAIVSVDVVGYSRLMGADETGTLAAFRLHREELIDPKIAEHGGRVVKTMGDGLLLEFPSVVNAVKCSIDVQTAMAARNGDVAKARRITFRIGINLGDIIIEGEDIHGDGVNVSARLQEVSAVGGLALSGIAREGLGSLLHVEFEDGGQQQFKNIARPIQVWRWTPEQPAAAKTLAPVSDKPSIAVLPFANMSSDQEQEYFADGMTDDLITHLSNVDGLFVIARNSVFTYKNVNVKVQDVGAELGVRYVLEGSVRRGGDVVRINAQLIDAATGGHIWADIFDRRMEDIFALQDEVTGEIVAALKAAFGSALETQSRQAPTANQAAYDIYLRAQQATRQLDMENLSAALSLFQEAITLDPGFADAYAGDAWAAALVWRASFIDILSSSEARSRAEQSIARALSLQPGHAGALQVRVLFLSMDGRSDEALAMMREIVAAEPNNAKARYRLANVLNNIGRPAEALTELEAALLLDPKPDILSQDFMMSVYYGNELYEKSFAIAREVEALSPKSFLGHNGVICSGARLGCLEEARAALAENLKLFPPYNVQLFVVYSQNYAPSYREDLLGAMRMAGVPEWPFGFQGDEANRLNGTEIEKLFLGRSIRGESERIGWFELIVDNAGNYRKANQKKVPAVAGKITVEDDRVCFQSPDNLLGRKCLSPVYRDPANSVSGQQAYVFPTQGEILRFSVPS